VLWLQGYDLIAKAGASSNAPLPTLTSGLEEWYLKAGVLPSKIVLGLPWYGYAFPCTEGGDDTTNTSNKTSYSSDMHTATSTPPPCNVPTTADRSTWQIGLGEILAKIAANQTVNHGFDCVSGSPYLEYMETSSHNPPLGRRQVWYEDAASFAAKVGVLVHGYGLKGVAMWSVDALWYAVRL
jgi:di-N-acetylchitobiase